MRIEYGKLSKPLKLYNLHSLDEQGMELYVTLRNLNYTYFLAYYSKLSFIFGLPSLSVNLIL